MNNVDTLILGYARSHSSFLASEVFSTLNGVAGGVVSKSVFYWRLRELVKTGNLSKTGYGKYSSVIMKPFIPTVSVFVKSLSNILYGKYPFAQFCYYEGETLSPFLHHISTNNVAYVEVDRTACDSVFHSLQSEGERVFLMPDKTFMDRYVNLSERSIIIKPLVSEAPICYCEDVPVSSLEKLLVDICADDDFNYLQGAESFYIFRNAIGVHQINSSRLLRYASRRGKTVTALINKYLNDI